MRSIALLLFAAALSQGAGCARYEYDIVRPPAYAQHIGEKQSVRFHLDPLDYDFISFSDRLVVRISNPTDTPIRLREDRSYVVDPTGQSHPMRGQTIAPGSFIKLILPPIPPKLEQDGPRIGFGLGIIAAGSRGRGYNGGYGRRYDGDLFFGDSYYGEPRYFTVYDGGESYWNWNGETDIHVSLYYVRDVDRPADTQPVVGIPAVVPDGAPIIHTFDLHRRKM